MDLQYKNLIEIISSYINNKNADIKNPDWNKITDLASIHNLKGILYVAVKDWELDIEVKNRLKRGFFVSVKSNAVQSVVADEFFELANNNNIENIVFKGYILRDYYPLQEIRTMGDIDVVIRDYDKEKFHNILIENGFVFDSKGSHQYVSNYTKNNTLFEVHTKLVSKKVYDDIDFSAYLENCFDNVVLRYGCNYELNKEYHFVYLIIHMAKHFKYGGCGIRMLLDIVFMINKYGSELNMDYINTELKKLRLYDFLCSIFSLCNMWFGCDVPLYEVDAIDKIGEYIIEGGVFGLSNKSSDAVRVGDKNKISIFFEMLFPSYSHLKERYVWMENVPKYMLPFIWVKYWVYRAKTGGAADVNRIFNAVKHNDDAKLHNFILEKVGLK